MLLLYYQLPDQMCAIRWDHHGNDRPSIDPSSNNFSNVLSCFIQGCSFHCWDEWRLPLQNDIVRSPS